jgi:circadian clock protein KaiC
MLAGGVYKGSTVLITGTPGSAKSTLAARVCEAACIRGERAVYVAFESSAGEIIRNVASVGIDLQQLVDRGLLELICVRPYLFGLEAHLADLESTVKKSDPTVIAIDPISDLFRVGSALDVLAMLNRLVDFLKARGITTLLISLAMNSELAWSNEEVSSLADAWILLRTIEGDGEINRIINVIKSRGMPHSNQMREFVLSNKGIDLADVYVGPEGVLIGSARYAQEARQHLQEVARQHEAEQR